MSNDVSRRGLLVGAIGAADAMLERNGTPRDHLQQAEIEEPITKAQSALGPKWEREYQLGHSTTVEETLTEAHAATIHPTT